MILARKVSREQRVFALSAAAAICSDEDALGRLGVAVRRTSAKFCDVARQERPERVFLNDSELFGEELCVVSSVDPREALLLASVAPRRTFFEVVDAALGFLRLHASVARLTRTHDAQLWIALFVDSSNELRELVVSCNTTKKYTYVHKERIGRTGSGGEHQERTLLHRHGEETVHEQRILGESSFVDSTSIEIHACEAKRKLFDFA